MIEKRRTSRAPNKVSLHRALSKLGYCSRSQAVKVIENGKVLVNGVPCNNPLRWVNLVEDVISVDAAQLVQEKSRYILFHKPEGVVTTSSDELGRKTIYDCLPPQYHNLKPVGRLDKDTSGLLILTNDSRFANKLTAPEFKVPKTYEVTTLEPLTQKQIRQLRNGVEITIERKNHFARPVQVDVLNRNTIIVVLNEGKNREVRRMISAVGGKVRSLKRVAIGAFQLGNLDEGEYQELMDDELQLFLSNC